MHIAYVPQTNLSLFRIINDLLSTFTKRKKKEKINVKVGLILLLCKFIFYRFNETGNHNEQHFYFCIFKCLSSFKLLTFSFETSVAFYHFVLKYFSYEHSAVSHFRINFGVRFALSISKFVFIYQIENKFSDIRQ